MADYSNSFIAEQILKAFPDFNRFISKESADLFKSRGFQMEMEANPDRANEVYRCINRFVLNKVDIADVRDTLAEIGEEYGEDYGFETQRLAVCQLPEMSPQARKIGRKGVNNQQVRDATLRERYITANDDFTNLVTRRFFQMREMFVSPNGIATTWGGAVKQLAASYVKHVCLMKKQAIHRGLTSTKYPLKDSQKITLNSWTTVNGRYQPKTEEVAQFVEEVNLVKSMIEGTESTDAFNAMSFDTAVDTGRLKMLCRIGMKGALKTRLYGAPGIVNKDEYTIPFDIVEIDNFGGIYRTYPVSDDFTGNGTEKTFELSATYDGHATVTVGGTATTAYTIEDNAITFETAPANAAAIVVAYDAKLFEVYAGENDPDTTKAVGEVIGYSLTEDSTEVSIQLNDTKIKKVDPHADILAMIIDKGYVFRIIRNPLSIAPEPMNHLGQYVNISAVAMNNTIATDPLYTCITISAPAE